MQDVPELFDLFRAVRLGERELPTCQDPLLVEERTERSGVQPIELALAGEEELRVGPVGQDEEGDRVQGEALQEQRLAEPFDDRRSIGQDLLVGVVPRDQARSRSEYSSASPWRPTR